MTGRHAPDDLVARYTDGSLPDSDAWSLEKHLESCAGCAARVSRAVAATATGTVLSEVRQAVLGAAPAAPTHTAHARPPAPARRARPRSGLRAAAGDGLRTNARHWSSRHLVASAGDSRWARVLWAAGPAVRGAWLPALLLVGIGAVVLAYGADFTGARSLLLALAPVVPVAGVAFSYGAHADPMHELAAATPSAGLRLVLTRTAVVLAVSLPLLTLAGLVLPSYGGPGAAAWLLPGLALTLASLALGGWLGLRAATAVTGGGWLCAVLAPALATPDGAVSAALTDQISACLGGAPAQGAWAAAAVLCAALLAARRAAYDRLERH
ncbi:zf-HC2 domain-containing protein [Streptomyces sp. P17]|uniref:zf-HC2 domain-containing protein n=1 Tax=Streptomyces sp. P17 TaxID=3074716 RepID=UPI0028F41DD5|nr:zf-HC2 domain-containing protein [Streptomyces sp. P17]MDT9699702.1 zf-HC2 domain-containing protein [Streptomyces sp. P17]